MSKRPMIPITPEIWEAMERDQAERESYFERKFGCKSLDEAEKFMSPIPPPTSNRPAIFAEINSERNFQERKWGTQRHEDGKWFLILMEEVGEASKASLEKDRKGLKAELIQSAAVIVAFLECIQDREEYGG